MREPTGGALRQARRAEVLVFLSVRSIHLVQGMIAVGTGFSSYHPPRLALGVLVTMTVESVWIAARDVRAQAHRPAIAVVDAATSLAGIVALGAATLPADRTTSLNWMLPYSVGAAVGLALSMPNVRGALITTALALAYVGTTWDSINAGRGPAATALANTASYLGFFLAVAIVARFVERFAEEFDRTRRAAIEAGERLAAEHERRRHQRLIHDSVLQTLEAMATGMAGGEAEMRVRAHSEAAALRELLGEQQAGGDLISGLRAIADELQVGRSLRVEIITSQPSPEPGTEVAEALMAAAREALMNVAKHAAATCAVVRLRTADQGIELIVRDEGSGFDIETTGSGFGITQSMKARMAEVGGRAVISSEPGLGTRVALWAPMP